MRTEATKEEWQQLYDLAARFKKMKPWERFPDGDIVCIRFSPEEAGYIEMVYIEGDCTTWNLYLGDKGLNDLVGTLFAEKLNLSLDFMVREQNSINLNMGDRDDVEEMQYKVIKDLGLKFRGRGNWIFFDTYESGFWPYLPDQGEVRLSIRYLEQFFNAYQYYAEHHLQVNFEGGEIYEYALEDGIWKGQARSILDRDYVRPHPVLSDELQIGKIKKAAKRKGKEILELDLFYTDSTVSDEKYDKPVNVKLALLVEKTSGCVVAQQVIEPDEDQAVVLSSMLADWIMQNGAPKQVLVANSLVESMVSSICEIAGIPLAVDNLAELEMAKDDLLDNVFGGYPSREEMEDMTDEELMAEFMSALNLDMEDLKEKAMTMSREDFAREALGQFAKGMRETGFSEEEIQSLVEIADEDYLGEEYTHLELKGRKQKQEAVRDFFGQGRIAEEDYEEFEKEIMIEPGSRTWGECLMEGKKEDLYQLTVQMGLAVNKSISKIFMTNMIITHTVHDSRILSSCMSKDARKLFRLLRRKAGEPEPVYLDKEVFGYSMETVLELLNFGLIDVGYCFDEEEIILELYPLSQENDPLGEFV